MSIAVDEHRWILADGYGHWWRFSIPHSRGEPRWISRASRAAGALDAIIDDAFAPWGSNETAAASLFEICARLTGHDEAPYHAYWRRGEIGWQSRVDSLRHVLFEAFKTGWLRCEPLIAAVPVVDEEAPATIRDPFVPEPEPTTWFELQVVDEIGEPVDEIEVVFTLAGARHIITTDRRGVARLEGVDTSSASAQIASVGTLRDRLAARWRETRPGTRPSGPRVHVSPINTLAPIRLVAETLETLVVVRPAYRARLIGFYFATNKSFLLPRAMRGIRGVARLYEQHHGASILVIGHTDAAGKNDYNDKLSLERAEAVVAYLTNDAASWTSCFDEKKLPEKRWGTLEVQQMLSALPEDGAPFYAEPNPSGVKDAATRAAVKRFQTWSNETRNTSLAVDGNAGRETRDALVRAYMDLDATSLPPGVEISAHGAGESFPEEPTPDGVATPDNRRVEVLIFEDGIHPPAPSAILAPGTPEYSIWREQIVDTLDLEHQGILIRVVDEFGGAVSFADVILVGPHEDRAVSDGAGLVTFANLPAGSYAARAEKDGYIFGESRFVYPPSLQTSSRQERSTRRSATPTEILREGNTVLSLRDAPPVVEHLSEGAAPSEEVVVVLQTETSVLVNVRDRTEAPIPDVVVTLAAPPGATIIGPATATSDATGKVLFKLSAAGDATVQARATAPFEAASRPILVTDRATTVVNLLLDTKFTAKHRFLWQNAALRPTMYPHRESMLKAFLTMYKAIDFEDPSRAPPDAKAKLQEYKSRVDGLKHKELVIEILNRFDADTSGQHEKWVRYMALHYSGLPYASAHGSFAEPRWLLRLLAREEVRDLTRDTTKTSAGRLLELAREARARVKREPKLYELDYQEKQSGKKGADPGVLADLSEAELDAGSNAIKRSDLCEHLATFFELTAKVRVTELSDAQVYGIAMSRAASSALAARRMPLEPWRIVLTYTPLKNDATSPDDIMSAKKVAAYLAAAGGLDEHKKPKEKPFYVRAIEKWIGRDGTEWRPYHAQTLEPFMTRVVCDQVDECSLHARGLQPNGGITGNALWTAKHSTAKQLKPLSSVAACEQRGSIFFSKWRTVNNEPDAPEDANGWRKNDWSAFDIETPLAGGFRLSETDGIDPATEAPWQVGCPKLTCDGAPELSWGSAVGASSYEVFRADVPAVPLTTPIAVLSSPDRLKYRDTTATNGDTYYYVVRGNNAAGPGVPSRVIGVTVDPPPKKLERPHLVLGSISLTGVVTLTWKGPSGAVLYHVYGAVGASPAPGSATPLTTAATKTTSFTHQPKAGERWHYVVALVNAKGDVIQVSRELVVEAGPTANKEWHKGTYTYHLNIFEQSKPHTEIVRTYAGSGSWVDKGNGKKEYVGKPDGATKKTSPRDPGIMMDVLTWEHEAAIVAVDPGRSRIITFETGEIGIHGHRQPGWSLYTGVAENQNLNHAKLDSFLNRATLEGQCDTDT